MVEYLDKINNYLATINTDALQALESVSHTKTFAKGDYLLCAGDTCKHSFLIVQGIARKYYLHTGKEITTELYFEHDLAIAFESYILQTPGKEYIEALSNVTATVINFEAFKALKQQYPQLLELDLMITEYYGVWLERRLFDFHTLTATERYKALLKNEPHIIKTIPLTIIASYLGISLETLSRIRSRAI